MATKKEIEAKLESLKIEFNSSCTKAELLDLLPADAQAELTTADEAPEKTDEEKAEEARLDEAGTETERAARIEREKAKEAKAESIKKLTVRQKFLDDLLNTLKAEGANSIGDIENKLARVNKDIEDTSKTV